MSTQIKNLKKDHLKNDTALLELILNNADSKFFMEFEQAFNKVCAEHEEKQELISTQPDLSSLELFKEWLPKLHQNLNVVVPILVLKMQYGNIYALSMFNEVYNNTGQFLLSYKQILANSNLKKSFFDYGLSMDARAKVTAEHWKDLMLTHLEKEEKLHQAFDTICNLSKAGMVEAQEMIKILGEQAPDSIVSEYNCADC